MRAAGTHTHTHTLYQRETSSRTLSYCLKQH